MKLNIMFSTINILFTFLIFKITCGQEQLRYDDKYRRSEVLANTPTKPHELKADSNANVHLLNPSLQLSGNADDLHRLANIEDPKPDPQANHATDKSELYSQHDSSKYKEVRASPPPYKVNYMQEKTAEQWPMGVVPYFIDTDIYDPTTIRRIVKTMGVVESSSCVIFKELDEKPTDSNDAWLHLSNPQQERECVHEFSSDDAGGTLVVLGFDCLHPNEILHSLLHAIGIKDEVSHPHRDQYIRILWDNIQPKYRHLYRIQYEDAPYKLVEYDPMSIMHFHDRAFSANGAATIAPMISGLQIGPANSLSPLDIMKLKLVFGHECNKRKIGDLLDTCKNALSSKKVSDVSEEGNGTKKKESAVYEDNSPEGSQKLKEYGSEGDHHAEKLNTDVEKILYIAKSTHIVPTRKLKIPNSTERKSQKFGKYGTG